MTGGRSAFYAIGLPVDGRHGGFREDEFETAHASLRSGWALPAILGRLRSRALASLLELSKDAL